MSDYKENEKREAIEALKRAGRHYTKPYEKKAIKAAKKEAKRAISSLGIDPDMAAKAAALAEIARTGRIKGKIKLDDSSSIEGELDAKNKSGRILYKKSF